MFGPMPAQVKAVLNAQAKNAALQVREIEITISVKIVGTNTKVLR
jgi:hypothetical protein